MQDEQNQEIEKENQVVEDDAWAKEEALGTTYGWVKEIISSQRELENEIGETEETALLAQVTLNKTWSIRDTEIFLAEIKRHYLVGDVEAWVAIVVASPALGVPELEAGGVWDSEETARDFCESMIGGWLDAFPHLTVQIEKVAGGHGEQE